nr:hypothetical protein [Gammaproteobacteria bacterium]
KGETGPQGPAGTGGDGGTASISPELTAFGETLTVDDVLVTADSNFRVDPSNMQLNEAGGTFSDQTLEFNTESRNTEDFALGTLPEMVGGVLGVRLVIGQTTTDGSGFDVDIETAAVVVGDVSVPLDVEDRGALQTLSLPTNIKGDAILRITYVGRNINTSSITISQIAWQYTIEGSLRADTTELIQSLVPVVPLGATNFDNQAQKDEFVQKLGFLPFEEAETVEDLANNRWEYFREDGTIFTNTQGDHSVPPRIGFFPEDIQRGTITYGSRTNRITFEASGSLHYQGRTYFTAANSTAAGQQIVRLTTVSQSLKIINDVAADTVTTAANANAIAVNQPLIDASNAITQHFEVDNSEVKEYSYTDGTLTVQEVPDVLSGQTINGFASARTSDALVALTRDGSVFTNGLGQADNQIPLIRGTERIEVAQYHAGEPERTENNQVWLTNGLMGVNGGYFREALGNGARAVSSSFSFIKAVPPASQTITFDLRFEENGNIHNLAPITLPGNQDSITVQPILFGGRTYDVFLTLSRQGTAIVGQIDNREPDGNPALAQEFLDVRGSYTVPNIIPAVPPGLTYTLAGNKPADSYMINAFYTQGGTMRITSIIGGMTVNIDTGIPSSLDAGITIDRTTSTPGPIASYSRVTGFTNEDVLSGIIDFLVNAGRDLTDQWFGLRTATTRSEIILRTDVRVVHAGQGEGGGGTDPVEPEKPAASGAVIAGEVVSDFGRTISVPADVSTAIWNAIKAGGTQIRFIAYDGNIKISDALASNTIPGPVATAIITIPTGYTFSNPFSGWQGICYTSTAVSACEFYVFNSGASGGNITLPGSGVVTTRIEVA